MKTSSTVPPAPILTFPNKGFGSKTKAKIATPLRSKSPASVEVETTLSAALKEQIFAIHDIRKMSQQERAELLRGPVTKIVLGNKVIDTMPSRLLLAVSPKARAQYEAEGHHIPKLVVSEQIDKASVKMLTQYVNEVSTKKTAFNLKKSQAGDIGSDLALLNAADDLGMRHYVNPIGRYWYNIIVEQGRVPTAEEKTAVEKHCPAAMEDRVFKAIANRIAHCLLDRVITFDEFHKDDTTFPKLHAATLRVYAPLQEAKAEQVRRAAQRATATAEKKVAAAERKSSFKQEKTDREMAQKVMNSGGGVKTVTAEQAAFFIRR